MENRFNYFFEWQSFAVGFEVCKLLYNNQWKYMLSVDLGFLSLWMYFGKSKSNN